MRRSWSVGLGVFVVAGAMWGQAAHYGSDGGVALPDPVVTPGLVRTTDAGGICAASFRTKPFRHTTKAMKKKVCSEYGVVKCPRQGTMELDHLVPLELGGADAVANLWPQMAEPRPGFHEKDELENYLRHHVCIEKDVTLAEAQAALEKDWYAAYRKYIGSR